MRQVLGVLNHGPSFEAVGLEREVVRLLNGDCHSPIGAYAEMVGGEMELQVVVAGRDGLPPVHRAQVRAPLAMASELPRKAVEKLRSEGYRG